jgi:ABC-type lipoprotein release transport system permease subunit
MLASELAHAVRGLRKQRGLAVSAVLTLGIAIAAASVIAVLANQALREPLPYRHASRLLLLWALALAAIGVYVVIAFGVAQRTREIGVRLAVGATTRDVIRLVLRQSLVLAGLGAVAGIGGGIAIARVLRATLDSVLYRTSPFAVLPLVIAAVVLGAITLAAAWMPARRAAGVDPVIALRSE